MHVFEKRARSEFEGCVQDAAELWGCDIAHVIMTVAMQLKALCDGIERGRADDAEDLRRARGQS